MGPTESLAGIAFQRSYKHFQEKIPQKPKLGKSGANQNRHAGKIDKPDKPDTFRSLNNGTHKETIIILGQTVFQSGEGLLCLFEMVNIKARCDRCDSPNVQLEAER
jgi:hypothetical protein